MDLKSASDRITIILGAGASRGVSYAHTGGNPSPLDADFFDLLRRLEPREHDHDAVESILTQVEGLPFECWRSMERAFYTLHLRAYMEQKLRASDDSTATEAVTKDFARCVQALLRAAHGVQECKHHFELFRRLFHNDTLISFNYDLVVERALHRANQERGNNFGTFLYGFSKPPAEYDFPLVLKLHGSSNWRLIGEHGRKKLEVRTQSWEELTQMPGYSGFVGGGTEFPIFLPFWDKRIEQQPWLKIWQRAFTRLQRTQHLVVWGYSLPPTDIKAQQLFALSFPPTGIDLCVIDPAQEARSRWREILPKAKYWEYRGVKEFMRQPPAWWEQREPLKHH